nr:Protein R06F6.12 [Haemonchus contortus]
MNADSVLMTGSNIDSREDSKPPLLLSEEPSLSHSDVAQCEQEICSPTPQSGKTVMVMPEDIEAAGLSTQNLSELTEEQFNALVLIAERRQRRGESSEASGLAQREQYDDQMAGSSSTGDSLTMVITGDGSLKLTDAAGQTFTFDRDQLAALRIDVNDLTDDSIQQIVQLAMPAINIGNKNLDLSKADMERPARIHSAALSGDSQGTAFKNDVVNSSPSVNEQVQISSQNSPRNAFIRYVRNGKCKVQYDDGRFEWIGEDAVDLCEVKPVPHSDHSGYHAGALPQGSDDTAVIVETPHMKRPCSVEATFNGPIPPKRRGLDQSPNFCCPVCDRKVYQKEPSYIVIRLPACDDCTKERMIVLDERARRTSLSSRK